MKRLILWLLIVGLCAGIPFARAESVVLDAAALSQSFDREPHQEEAFTFAAEYISVSFEIADEGTPVNLMISDMDTDGALYQKDYGQVKGLFVSDDVYLASKENPSGRYRVTLSIGDQTLHFPFYKKALRLLDNTACSWGLRFSDMDARFADQTHMAMVIDLLKEENQSVPMVAGGMHTIGEMNVAVLGGELTVSYEIFAQAHAQIKEEALYIITDLSELPEISPRYLRLYPPYSMGQAIDINEALPGARYALLYAPMILDYEPQALQRFQYDASPFQMDLFIEFQQQGMPAPVG